MQKIRKIVPMLLMATMALGLTACGGNQGNNAEVSGDSALEAIQSAGKIVMVTNAEFPPMEFKDGNEIIGIDAEIAAIIAEEIGVELEITDIDFDACIPSITEGRADFVAAGMTVTEDRLKTVDFTDSYFTAAQAVIVPIGSDIKTYDDLDGKKVGVQQGTTGDTFATDENGESGLTMEVSRYKKGMDAVSNLIAGGIEAVIIDNYTANKLVAANSDKVEITDISVSEEEEYAIAVAKGSDLTAKINEVLAKIKEDGRFDEIVTKYLEAE